MDGSGISGNAASDNKSDQVAKKDSTDGMGMWLFGSSSAGEADNKTNIQLTANGLPYIEKTEGFDSALNAVYINADNYMYPTVDLEKFMK